MKYEFIEDLIPLILDADEHWWQSHLAALATVSQAWLYYVRKRLYACPDIRTFGGVQKLADAVEANEYLGTLVKGISLQPLMSNSPEPVWRGMVGARRGMRILLGLEGLKKITLGGDMGMKADRYIRYIGKPEGVEEMHLNGSRQLIWPRVVGWDEMLMFGFPRLKRIRLSEVDVDVSTAGVGYPASFTELILEDVHIMYGRLVQMLNGASRLRCLHVSIGSYGLVDEEQLREVLMSCAVECLHYDVRRGSTRWNPFADLDGECGRRVRCLHLDGHMMDAGSLDTLRRVFGNVEELVVGGRLVRVSAGEWARFVAGGALGSLRRLRLPGGTNWPPYAQWSTAEVEDIRAACGLRGIERGKVI